jgi:hypothetical protein
MTTIDLSHLRVWEYINKLGILNIDVPDEQLSPEIIKEAIEATEQLDARLDKKIIAQKLQKADSILAAQYRY